MRKWQKEKSAERKKGKKSKAVEMAGAMKHVGESVEKIVKFTELRAGEVEGLK